MYQWLQALINDSRQSLTFSTGVEESEIEALEARLGIHFPPSYRNFLLFSDGAVVCSEQLFSIPTLLDYINLDCGFKPYDGELCLAADSGQPHRHIYQLKPTHFLAFGMPEHSADLYCLDTSKTIDGEYPVCEFSHDEDDMERILRLEYPSFSAFLLDKLYDDLELVDAFWDNTLEEEEAERYFEEKAAYWHDYLKKALIVAGANMDELFHRRWDKWRREHSN